MQFDLLVFTSQAGHALRNDHASCSTDMRHLILRWQYLERRDFKDHHKRYRHVLDASANHSYRASSMCLRRISPDTGLLAATGEEKRTVLLRKLSGITRLRSMFSLARRRKWIPKAS